MDPAHMKHLYPIAKTIIRKINNNDPDINLNKKNYEDFLKNIEIFKEKISDDSITNNYKEQLYKSLEQFTNSAKWLTGNKILPPQIKVHLSSHVNNYIKLIQSFNLNIWFFDIINYMSQNIVAVGANGSGKSTLSNKFREILKNGIVLSAQRALPLPILNSIDDPQRALHDLKVSQKRDKTYKDPKQYHLMSSEFDVVLKSLIAEHNKEINIFHSELLKHNSNYPTPITKLNKVLNIWNYLISHREISCLDGINFEIKDINSSDTYNATQLSDGEKVIIYLTSQVLLAPENGFIVVDEPEIYLHKAILYKLWDALEKERDDCIFVYLTHDLDFASSRVNSKKLWIKSYTHPDKWEIEDLPSSVIPEPLLMELLGSRKKVIFCEGKKTSKDRKIYSIIYPNNTIIPVESCANVINYTKSFNKLPNTLSKAIGIIDRDFSDRERESILSENNIHIINVSEIENLLLDENFLIQLSLYLDPLLTEDKTTEIINEIKNKTLEKFKSDIIFQSARYLSFKVDNLFSDTNIEKGNTLEEFKEHYEKFDKTIKLDFWFNERKEEIEKLISDKDYLKAIRLFNNKGLKKFANDAFKVTNFQERAIRFLSINKEAQNRLRSLVGIDEFID